LFPEKEDHYKEKKRGFGMGKRILSETWDSTGLAVGREAGMGGVEREDSARTMSRKKKIVGGNIGAGKQMDRWGRERYQVRATALVLAKGERTLAEKKARGNGSLGYILSGGGRGRRGTSQGRVKGRERNAGVALGREWFCRRKTVIKRKRSPGRWLPSG